MNRATLKAEARGQLLGHYGVFIRIFIMTQLISLFLLQLIDSICPSGTVGTVMYYIGVVLIELLNGVLSAGAAYCYLQFSAGRDINFTDLFYCFKNHPDKAILIEFCNLLAVTVCFLPAELLLRLHKGSFEISAILGIVGIFIIGAVAYLWYYLNFTFLFYLMHDFPDRSVWDLFRICYKSMDGYRLKLLAYQLSFLPYWILGILSWGIGFCWINPYMNSSKVHFYLTMLEEKSQKA